MTCLLSKNLLFSINRFDKIFMDAREKLISDLSGGVIDENLGNMIWIPDASDIWRLEEVFEQSAESVTILLNDEPKNFKREDVHPFDPSHSLNLEVIY